MRRIAGIACMLAVTFLGVVSCSSHLAGRLHAVGRAAARRVPPGTGWIPPGPALPADASAAPNLVYLDTLGTFGYATPAGPQQSLVIYRVKSLSGATRVAVIAPPYCCDFQFVNAADDDRTFLAAATHGSSTRFYELRLRADGRPQPLIPLSLTVPGDVLPDSVTLTPDGRELAAVTTRGADGPYGISVVATATGRSQTWTWRGTRPEYPAWSGDHGVDFIINSLHGAQLVRLDTAASSRHSAFAVLASHVGRSGNLARWSPWRADGLMVTAGGGTAFVPLTGGGDWNGSGAPRIALLRLSATTGAPLQVLAEPWAVPAGNNELNCGTVWADASGRHFAFTCGPISGRVDDGRFTRMVVQPTPYVPFPDSVFAW